MLRVSRVLRDRKSGYDEMTILSLEPSPVFPMNCHSYARPAGTSAYYLHCQRDGSNLDLLLR
jgi:hypothetical protein